MFINGAATTGLIEETVVADYNTYKYIFRAIPMNDNFLLNNCIAMLAMVGGGIEAAAGVTPRVAIFAEELSWADLIVLIFQNSVIPSLGWTHTYTARVPDDASSTVVATHLAAIEEEETHIIITVLSGPVGLTYGTQMGVLGIPAMSVGINVEAQDPSYWINTDGGAAYQITLGFLAPNVRQTALTGPFLTKFQDHTGGEFPIYTASSYDIVLGLKDAIEAVGSFTDTDALIAWFEDPANARLTTGGYGGYYPEGLESPYNRHDLIYACDGATGIGVQWLDGDIVGVWPKAEYGELANAVSLYGPACWAGFEHDGTEHFQINDVWVTEWTS